MMLDLCIQRYPELEVCREDMQKTIDRLISCYENNGKLLICGNGGSCADAEHIVGELMKGFLKKRPIPSDKRQEMIANEPQVADLLDNLQEGLSAIPLTSFAALNSAFCNDVEPSMIYAQNVLALAKPGDVLLGLSTSGNSKNVVNAALVARSLGITVITMTGENGGKLRDISDICIRVPAVETYQVQELHLPVYHTLCAAVEQHFYSE